MKRVLIKNSKGKKLVVQESQIPAGFKKVEDYKEPAKKKPEKQV